MLFNFFFKKKNYVYLFFVVFRDIIVTKESIRELETAPETETRWLDSPGLSPVGKLLVTPEKRIRIPQIHF